MEYYNVVTPKPIILLIDAAHMLRRAQFQPNLRELSNAVGMPTGGIYGFMKSLQSTISGMSASTVVVCHEGGHSERRKQVYGEYKARTYEEEPPRDIHGYTDYAYYKHQLSWVEKILDNLGVHQLRVPGKEGDDIIFQATRLLKGQKIIISEDSDFFSLISEDVAVYRPIKKVYVDLSNFEEITGLPTPLHYLYSKVLQGDGSDNIPAVAKGVGWKTIKDVLCKIEDPSQLNPTNILKEASRIKGSRYQKLVEAGTAPITRNLDLIDISREVFNIFELEELSKNLSTQIYPNLDMALKLFRVLEFNQSTTDSLVRRVSTLSEYSMVPLIDKDYMRRVMLGSTSALQG